MHAGSSRAQSAPAASPKANSPALAPGTTIDASNVGSYLQYLPVAAQAAINHGLKLQVVPTRRLDWSAGFTEATEKYASQVGLDTEDSITNYVAGVPFPTVTLSDPKAAVKIAYNWHMGPFMPDDFSLTPWGSFAYSNSGGDTIQPEDDSNFICQQFTFLRFAHRTEVDPRPTMGSNSQGFEWKARCNSWTSTPQGFLVQGTGIWVRYLDPHRGDEFFCFEPRTRRNRHESRAFMPANEQCRSCHQPYWAYGLPKTEEYTYRVLGTAALLASLTASDEPAGLVADGGSLKMSVEPSELRNAYILEMIPKGQPQNLRSLVYIDTEAYVWLAAEFFEGNERTATAIPLWRSHPSSSGGNLFDLAGEFYVPDQQTVALHNAETLRTPAEGARWFFRALMPPHSSFEQKINTGEVSEANFNPQFLSH
jgi:hypothetical protein